MKAFLLLSAWNPVASPAATDAGDARFEQATGISHDPRCCTLLLYFAHIRGLRISNFASDLWS